MKFSNFVITFTFLLTFFFGFSQRGIHPINTITAANTVVNTYTSLSANAGGSFSIQVASNAMTGAQFTTPLRQGDLVMIIQMQGANMNIDWWDGTWGGQTKPFNIPVDLTPNEIGEQFGTVSDYANSGKFEVKEVQSVTGTTTINFLCPLEKSYTASGHTQVIRIPRFNDLTLNSNTSIIPTVWNGTTGGVVAIEVLGNLTLNSNSLIDASGFGFRGGVAEGTSITGSGSSHTFGPGNGSSPLGWNRIEEGGTKGEGIGGYRTEYQNNFYSLYGRGAMANGGGGGGYQNAGGGGGSNIGTGTRTGKGIPTPGYATYWNLEKTGFAASVSPGGGRGGYSLSQLDANETTVGPNKSNWGGDYRKENGGYGGDGLTYDASRIFMGGGGGAGGQDSNQGGSGGAGGGICYLEVYGNVSGSGTIRSNGQAGKNSNMAGSNATNFNPVYGNDGAGGAGAGGYIYIKNMNAIPSTISLIANGGNGGDQDFRKIASRPNEIGGPGAGGAGGGIVYSSGAPVTSVVGGASGFTLLNGSNNTWMANFPPNGATNGGTGMTNLPSSIYNIIPTNDTVCSGGSATVSAAVNGVGSLPSSTTIVWYSTQFGTSSIYTGTTLPPGLTPAVTTTYYVGICPGTFRVPVTIVVGQNPTISGTASITGATCSTAGSISGLSASGGVAPLIYSWNGTTYPNANLPSAPTGNYTLTVTDQNGCSSQSGPYTINGVGGPTITGTPIITNATCTANGSITGLTASGGVGALTFTWNGVASASENLSNAPAASYTLIATDQNGCTASSGPHVIGTTPGPTVSGIANITDATCTVGGSITGLSGTGGVGPYTYAWNGITGTPGLSGATAGNYTLVITDNNGCTVSSGPHTIGTTPGPTVAGTVTITNATCTAGGSISGLTGTGGVGPYAYAWNGTTGPSNLTGAAAGDYTLVITDYNGCTVSSGPHTIATTAGPTITGPPTITDVGCTTSGSITGLIINGGAGPFGYAWNGNITPSQDLTNAAAGNYTLIVVDFNGCTATSGPYTINGVLAPTISGTPIITNATCTVNGSITGLTASGGTGALAFTWNGITSPSENLSNAPAANYTLIATDQNGCTASSGPHVIGTTPGPTVSGTANITDATCTVGGSINGLSGTGGVGPYTYAWNGITGTPGLSNATAGNYTLVITDYNGCTVSSGPHTIGTTPSPTVAGTANITDATCTVAGSISGLTGTGGVGPYTYAWNGTTGPSNLTGAAAGDYTLVVTDINGCTVSSGPHTIGTTAGPIITGPPVIADATCVTGGSITGLSVNGGVGPFGYAWNGNASVDQDITNAVAGNYTLVIVDFNGCTASSGPYTINLVGGPVIDDVNLVVTNESCGNVNGSIVGLTVSGGTPDYTYTWNGVASASLDNTNLAAGSYTLQVTDDSGCSISSEPYDVTNTPAPTIDDANVVIVNESCSGTLGSITGITATGNNLIYTWTNSGGVQIDATNLTEGSYSLTVTDQVSGCSAQSGPYVVGNVNGPVVSSINVVVTDEICNGTLGTISGITATGSGVLTYSWTNSTLTSLDLTGLSAGTYSMTVTDDATGCSAVAGPFTVNYISGPNAAFVYSPIEPFVDELVTFTNQSSGTITNTTWNIDTLTSLNQNETYTFSEEGSYYAVLTVVDQNGCTDQETVLINVSGNLVIPNVITPNSDGTNDFFEISGLKSNTNVIILNRWGNEIFNSANYLNDWNGRDKAGDVVTEGVYTYVLTLPDGSQKHGFVHVVHNN